MARTRNERIPTFRHHKATGQGYVVLNGVHLYLGRYDKSCTLQKYHRTIAEWCANEHRLPVEPEDITVSELCAAYWKHAQSHYVGSDGTPTSSVHRVKRVLTPLKELYGRSKAHEFGPTSLRAVRDAWIGQRLARSTVNDYTALLKNLFK